MTEKFARWSADEDALLRQLFDGERLTWLQIAGKLPGRTAAACSMRYYKHLGGAKGRPHRLSGLKPCRAIGFWRRRAVIEMALAAQKPVPAPDAATTPPVVERRRMPALDHLREAAEMRLRIDRQGLTAGFFGDPPPGRSALDQRASGLARPLGPSLPGEASDVG